MELIRIHAFISGIVQGVGYRFTTQDRAVQLGVRGWVRNLPDGRVEAVFEGPKQLVEEMVRWCYQGPRGAIVRTVDVAYEPPEGLQGFEIRR
ncbi:acylphosphatase [Leptothermofonsia sichuanensis E412]|uniref:acylphosphatase n=1 Tax=Leptothermofonsia sichuanensis TaxID=2917832 RepID=UPI001CA72DB0|nr:acylphosphatase [Leptothermofonsia sichuanensis]QZZ22153.1 acylphosphatase [Leptothermofonsia sichuanensis E412]